MITYYKKVYARPFLREGGLVSIRRGYLRLSVIKVPDVRRDLDSGSAADINPIVRSLSWGEHLRMHHPSAHWMIFGGSPPAKAASLPARDSLVSPSLTVNAMYLRLPLLDLTTIGPPSFAGYILFLDGGHLGSERPPAPAAHPLSLGYPFPAPAYERAVRIGYHGAAGAYVPVHRISASGTCHVTGRSRRQEVLEAGAAVGAFPGGLGA